MARSSIPELSVSSVRIFRILVGITAFLVITHITLQALYHLTTLPIPDTLVGRFDVDNEISIPTWWSQFVLFLSAALGVVAYKVRRDKKGAWLWLAFSALFLFLSMDEGAMLHEAFITKFREATTDGTATGLANHLWLIPVAVVIILLMPVFIRFVRTIPRRVAILIGVGVASIVFGGVVYETFGLMMFADASPFMYQGINVAIEETFEMLGASIVLYGVLEYLRLTSPKLTVSVQK